MLAGESGHQFLDAVRKHQNALAQLIRCAEKLCQRLPQFDRIDAARIQATKELNSLPPDGLIDDAEATARWWQEKRRAYDEAQARYTRSWKAIGAFKNRVTLELCELRNPHCESDGSTRKILSDRESDQLIKETDLGEGSVDLGGTLPATLRALRTAAQQIDDLYQERLQSSMQPRRGFRKEIRKYMDNHGLTTIKEAAVHFGVSTSALKSVMSEKGQKRYSVERLQGILKKIGFSEQ